MNLLSILKSRYSRAVVLGASVVSGSAFAESTNKSGMDLSPLTDNIDFTSVMVAIMAIAGSLVALYAGYVGVRWVLRMVKGA